jgi:type I site-specific restriction endonuclease
MTEFKQIVGRGTRVHEDTRKFYFTLIDFRGATSHFADPEFDGEPVQLDTSIYRVLRLSLLGSVMVARVRWLGRSAVGLGSGGPPADQARAA